MATRRSTREARRWRSRRIRALLASGLVLGVGAAMTLAAWNDSEHTTANFAAGTFGILGSVNGAPFSENPAPPGAVLPFHLPANPMVPGTALYAGFRVKTAPSSVAGTVLLKAGTGNGAGLGAHLRYRVRTIASTAICDSSSFTGGTAVPGLGSPTPLTTGATTPQDLSKDGENEVNYCFEVVLPIDASNLAQRLTLAATWEFAGTAT